MRPARTHDSSWSLKLLIRQPILILAPALIALFRTSLRRLQRGRPPIRESQSSPTSQPSECVSMVISRFGCKREFVSPTVSTATSALTVRVVSDPRRSRGLTPNWRPSTTWERDEPSAISCAKWSRSKGARPHCWSGVRPAMRSKTGICGFPGARCSACSGSRSSSRTAGSWCWLPRGSHPTWLRRRWGPPCGLCRSSGLSTSAT
jgi:hypothetical protein